MGELTQLDAVEEVLRLESRPMSSREIATLVQQTTEVSLTGSTPWKTVNARLSEDIRTRGDSSKFLRTGQGQFGLREWEGVKEFHSFKRKLKPLDEVIRVIPRDLLSTHKLTEVHTGVFDIDIRSVLIDSIEMVRLEAEEVVEVTQLVPTFLVRLGDELLCYTRTKRLPEARLHHRR